MLDILFDVLFLDIWGFSQGFFGFPADLLELLKCIFWIMCPSCHPANSVLSLTENALRTSSRDILITQQTGDIVMTTKSLLVLNGLVDEQLLVRLLFHYVLRT